MSDEGVLPLRLLRQLQGKSRRPRIIITTSHRPSRRTRSLVKDLEAVIDGSVRLTRGHLSFQELAAIARELGVTRVVMIFERKGNPGLIVSYALSDAGLSEVARIQLSGVTLRRELRSRADIRCQGVYSATPDAEAVADLIAKAFDLNRVEGPVGGYLEVKKEEGVFVVMPRYGSSFSGPVLRVRWREGGGAGRG
ncbi:MAG: Brix domain-containing protein [Acidilobus sp.]